MAAQERSDGPPSVERSSGPTGTDQSKYACKSVPLNKFGPLQHDSRMISRNARCIGPGLPYHVTQRGTNSQRVFFSPTDYKIPRFVAGVGTSASFNHWAGAEDACLGSYFVHTGPRC